jgi:hypothetical protein
MHAQDKEVISKISDPIRTLITLRLSLFFVDRYSVRSERKTKVKSFTNYESISFRKNIFK